VLKRALNGARDAFLEVLDGYTLADLVEPRARLSALLGIS
jgi:Rrf2 family nitric oxide-sensitive transcriptional repressor